MSGFAAKINYVINRYLFLKKSYYVRIDKTK